MLRSFTKAAMLLALVSFASATSGSTGGGDSAEQVVQSTVGALDAILEAPAQQVDQMMGVAAAAIAQSSEEPRIDFTPGTVPERWRRMAAAITPGMTAEAFEALVDRHDAAVARERAAELLRDTAQLDDARQRLLPQLDRFRGYLINFVPGREQAQEAAVMIDNLAKYLAAGANAATHNIFPAHPVRIDAIDRQEHARYERMLVGLHRYGGAAFIGVLYTGIMVAGPMVGRVFLRLVYQLLIGAGGVICSAAPIASYMPMIVGILMMLLTLRYVICPPAIEE